VLAVDRHAAVEDTLPRSQQRPLADQLLDLAGQLGLRVCEDALLQRQRFVLAQLVRDAAVDGHPLAQLLLQ